MSIVEEILRVVQPLLTAIMWVMIVLFIAKTLWNLGVPYAMIREALLRPENKHGWSLFILLDVGLLVLAVVTSALAGQYATIGPWHLTLYGLIAIAVSYIHLFIALLLSGYIYGLFPKNDRKGEGEGGEGDSSYNSP